MMILYEYYTYCQSEMLHDLLNGFSTLTLDNVDYQQFKEGMHETLRFKLDLQEHLCEICYQNLLGAEKFLIIMGCNHYFCKNCMKEYA